MELIERLWAAARDPVNQHLHELLHEAANKLAASDFVERDEDLVRYDLMDPENPPPWATLEICPNCKLPAGFVFDGEGYWVYVHSFDRVSGKRRHYCKLSNDGRDVEMVMRPLPAEEKHGLQQDATV